MLSLGVDAVAGEAASVAGGLSPEIELMLVCLDDRRESLVFSVDELFPLRDELLRLEIPLVEEVERVLVFGRFLVNSLVDTTLV